MITSQVGAARRRDPKISRYYTRKRLSRAVSPRFPRSQVCVCTLHRDLLNATNLVCVFFKTLAQLFDA